jgi:hypothetical protein
LYCVVLLLSRADYKPVIFVRRRCGNVFTPPIVQRVEPTAFSRR